MKREFDAWVLADAQVWEEAKGILETDDTNHQITLVLQSTTSTVHLDEQQDATDWRALQVLACGLCGTDVASCHGYLPFSFPMVIGHELVVADVEEGSRYLVEINASHASQNHPDQHHCGWCQQRSIPGISDAQIHCPARRTVGIDRMIGGLCPFVLLPRGNLIPIPSECPLSPSILCLCEPLAAAIQAIHTTSFQESDRVAVLGPRRLGMLLIAAFTAMKAESQSDQRPSRFRSLDTTTLTALHRHDDLLQMALELGADETMDTRKLDDEKLHYDIVYDCTGTQSGFESAARLARREVHLKSTCGSDCFGCKEWTAFVVDELSLFAWSPQAPCAWKDFRFTPLMTAEDMIPPLESGPRIFHVYCSPSVELHCWASLEAMKEASGDTVQFHVDEPSVALDRVMRLGSNPPKVWGSPFPRYDVALISSLAELDRVVRPDPIGHVGVSLVRSRMPVILCPPDDVTHFPSLLERRLHEGLVVRTSRCGSLPEALRLLSENTGLAGLLQKHLISHYFSFQQAPEAVRMAQEKECTKAVVCLDIV